MDAVVALRYHYEYIFAVSHRDGFTRQDMHITAQTYIGMERTLTEVLRELRSARARYPHEAAVPVYISHASEIIELMFRDYAKTVKLQHLHWRKVIVACNV